MIKIRLRPFQSTHPLRGATIGGIFFQENLKISIHAPLAGCDNVFEVFDGRIVNFNPRTPCGVRLFASSWLSLYSHFNPRTPCGVRPVVDDAAHQSICISIHAPLAGCDTQARRPFSAMPEFQSTHPLRGATFPYIWTADGGQISIHAPLAGCDRRQGHLCVRVRHFNPRTPCGVRPYYGYTFTYGFASRLNLIDTRNIYRTIIISQIKK